MNRHLIHLWGSFILWFAVLGFGGETPSVFPLLEGWTLDASPQSYGPDTLYDYMDGAAEVFISYAFERLEVGFYRRGGNSSLTMEVFRHASPEDAFGIFSRERPENVSTAAFGGAGFLSGDRATFISGRYYVKIAAVGLPKGADVLSRLVRGTAERIEGPPVLPGALKLFPMEGRRAGSERYFAEEYLGYSCLPRAFSVRYEEGTSTTEAFLIKLASPSEAESMARCLASQKGMVLRSKTDRGRILRDPHHGTLSLEWNDQWLWGVKGEGVKSQALMDRMRASAGAR